MKTLELKEGLLKKWIRSNTFLDVSILSAHLEYVLILSGTYTNGNVCVLLGDLKSFGI